MKRRGPGQGRAARPVLESLEIRALLAGWSATGAGPGSPPEVQIFDPSGIEQTHFLAFAPSFRGGVQVALGDVNGDGTPDVIAGTGSGGGKLGGQVRVFDGSTGLQLAGPLGDFHPFSPRYRGGVFVTTADVNGDGISDIIVGSGPGQRPRVEIFSGANGSVLANFLAFAPSFRGGVRVAAGDFTPGEGAEVAVGAGPGSLPLVKVFDPVTQKVIARYTAFAPSFRGGVYVGAGDVNGDGITDVVAGQGPGGRSRVRAFSSTTNGILATRLAYGPGSSAGVQVGVGVGGGSTSVFVAAQSGRRLPVMVLSGPNLQPLQSLTGARASRSRGGSVAGIASPPPGHGASAELDQVSLSAEYPLLDRLAEFDPNTNLFNPIVSPITNSTTTPQNVYVIAHGWMPGYLDWVNSNETATNLPTSWQTWQGPYPLPADGPSTPWLFQEVKTTDPVFDVTTTGMAQQILAVDPNATVLAYSWIDDSASTTFADIPEDAYHSEAYTAMNGMRMAEAITQALAPNYYQGLGKVDLIGHSHGARVATVAALALQQAAATDPADNVVGQLTLLDSPEDDNADVDSLNPVDLDAANFDWFYLSQLSIARTMVLAGNTTMNQTAVAGLNTTNLVTGMGASGAGIPTGTTVASIDPSDGQVTLSAPATATGSTSITFTPPPRAIFVDSYVSYFGSSYNNFVVNDPDQGINNQALTNVVDVQLNPLPFSSLDTSVISLEHEYAASWYAGSQFTSNLPANQQVGLFWSPLVPNPQTNLPDSSAQTWTDSNLNQSTQFVLAPQPSPAPVQPVFTPVSVTQNSLSGDATSTMTPAGVSSVTLTDDQSANAAFDGTFNKTDSSIVGFSFNYDFSQVGDGAQLQIWLNGNLYFAMTGDVAKSSSLPGSGELSATFGLGAEWSGWFGNQDIQIVLAKPASTTGPATTVTVSNFHTFAL